MTSTTSGWSFEYDANCNQDDREDGTDTFTLTYDEESRLDGVSGDASATFVYDGDGNRIKQANPDGTTKLFLGGGA